MKVRTEAIQFKADQKLIDFIEKKVSKLERFHDRILDAKVILKLENNSAKIKEKIAEVQLQIPGDVVVAKASDKSFEASILTAVEVLTRNLKKRKEKLAKRA
ncbi:MAG: ribosome-associated translation inhibitor RaiA [Bacteroidota bacterium]